MVKTRPTFCKSCLTKILAGIADRTAYVRRPASDFRSRTKSEILRWGDQGSDRSSIDATSSLRRNAHRLNGSSSPVLTATSLSYGKAKNSTPHRIKTPDSIKIKFGTVNYVGEGTRHAKFYANPSKGGFPANGWNIRKNFCIHIPFFSSTHLEVRPFGGFLRAMAQTTRSRARMCLLGVKKIWN